jgi:uncharacterized protein YlaN (UPF0358 family)
MEDIQKINQSLINEEISYLILPNETYISYCPKYFVTCEKNIFGIEDKIKKLSVIIDNIIKKLDVISYENKKDLIETLETKKNKLQELLVNYNDIVKKYLDIDNYYRDNLFEFYRDKYYNSSFFAFSEKRNYLAIMTHIQLLLKARFDDFCHDYIKIWDKFFDINKYIIKIKKLFNINV